MYNIIKCELFKLRKTNSFWVIMGTMAVLGVIMVLFGYTQKDTLIEMGMESELTGISMYLSNLKDSSLIMLMGSILAGTFIGGDFENRMIQSAIAGGCSRTSLVIGKSLVYYIALSLMLLPYPLVAMIVMSLIFQLGAPLTGALILQLLAVLITVFFINAAIMSISILIALLFQKSGLIIGISMAILILAGNLLMSAGNMIPVLGKILSYTPFGLTARILSLDALPVDFIRAIVLSIIYIIGFLSVSSLFFRKMELK